MYAKTPSRFYPFKLFKVVAGSWSHMEVWLSNFSTLKALIKLCHQHRVAKSTKCWSCIPAQVCHVSDLSKSEIILFSPTDPKAWIHLRVKKQGVVTSSKLEKSHVILFNIHINNPLHTYLIPPSTSPSTNYTFSTHATDQFYQMTRLKVK